ncbi:permease [Arsenicitalea aurantiaca]|uniref:Permease n=1 Tax=Arsenicitalea aurantiaca TaxID=1783274 RepID=A0A433XL74_9HYPH|nr:permease [Arsenicitalea aurantiaca]RUT34837.1 permease [Arsenicitalea aurantiaca]
MPGSAFALMARHEARLALRDFAAMATAGKPQRLWFAILAFIGVAALLHVAADIILAPWIRTGVAPDRETLTLMSFGGLLFFTVTLAQSLEAVTRVYYGRADLDLYLSSPASPATLFIVRTGAVALQSAALSCLLASPVVNVLVLRDGLHWLAAYPVLVGLAMVSVAISILVTLVLFATVGARRTRLVAQIVAAIVGAGFAIGVQAAAIAGSGTFSRLALLTDPAFAAGAPGAESLLFFPARAAMGDPVALLAVLLAASLVLGAVFVLGAPRFARQAVAAIGVGERPRTGRPARPFVAKSPADAMRRKEWRLLARDPWLVSQSLMQVLYLLPPALLLWLNYGDAAGIWIVVVPVLVMASGQLAGGLAWLAVSGEDAHDLVRTAPLPPGAILRAKVEAVLAVVGMLLAPFLLAILIAEPRAALITAIGAAFAAGSATAIQLWFRMPMRRAMFRRRQVASRIATLTEALASILWAGMAALLLVRSPLMVTAALPALLALGTVALAWGFSPARAQRRG